MKFRGRTVLLLGTYYVSETRTLTTLLCSSHCCNLFCSVTRNGNFTGNGNWDVTQAKENGAKGRLFPALFLIQEPCHCSHSDSFLSVYLKALFFLAWLPLLISFVLGHKELCQPHSCTHHWLGKRITLLSWNSLWNISGFWSLVIFLPLGQKYVTGPLWPEGTEVVGKTTRMRIMHP